MSDALFDAQYHAMERAANRSGGAERRKKRKREEGGGGEAEQQQPGSGQWKGPWATPDDVAERDRREQQEADEQEQEQLRAKEEEAAAAAAKAQEPEPAQKRGREDKEYAAAGGGTSVLHLRQERDYQGRTFVEPPTTWKAGREHTCYLPKRVVHTFAGHTKGVTCIRLAPQYGHLALSAGLDGQLKVWRLVDDDGE
jgi:pre-mRNA-processing factor 17